MGKRKQPSKKEWAKRKQTSTPCAGGPGSCRARDLEAQEIDDAGGGTDETVERQGIDDAREGTLESQEIDEAGGLPDETVEGQGIDAAFKATLNEDEECAPISVKYVIVPIDEDFDAYFQRQGQVATLEHDEDPLTLERSMRALRALCGIPRVAWRPSVELCSVLVKCDKAAACQTPQAGMDNLCVEGFLASSLNDTQLAGAMCGVRQSFSIIEGPPGTGKTSVSLSILATWVGHARDDRMRDQRTKILATAGSNTAVDNLADGLHRLGINVVRAGRRSNIREATQRLNPTEQRMPTALLCADVVCATAYGVADASLADFSFNRVLADEAAQSTEVASLVPM